MCVCVCVCVCACACEEERGGTLTYWVILPWREFSEAWWRALSCWISDLRKVLCHISTQAYAHETSFQVCAVSYLRWVCACVQVGTEVGVEVT